MRFAVGKRHAFVLAASPLLAIAIAVMVFVIGNSADTTEAETVGPAMSLRVDASQQTDCPGGPQAGKVCVVLGQKFDVILVADGIPAAGYVFAQGWIKYGPATSGADLVYKPTLTGDPPPIDTTTKAIWPDVSPNTIFNIADLGPPNYTAAGGGLTGVLDTPKSNYKGDLFSFSFTCTSAQSSSFLDLLPAGPLPAGTSGAIFTSPDGPKFVPDVTGLTVNCVPCPPQGCPTVTPPPTPVPPVGGVGVFPDSGDSSGSSSLVVFTGFAAIATAVALAGAAWYARRRWARS